MLSVKMDAVEGTGENIAVDVEPKAIGKPSFPFVAIGEDDYAAVRFCAADAAPAVLAAQEATGGIEIDMAV